MKNENHPFAQLTIIEKSKIPVIYSKLEKAPIIFQRKARSTFHRSEAFNCYLFHKPISQFLEYKT